MMINAICFTKFRDNSWADRISNSLLPQLWIDIVFLQLTPSIDFPRLLRIVREVVAHSDLSSHVNQQNWHFSMMRYELLQLLDCCVIERRYRLKNQKFIEWRFHDFSHRNMSMKIGHMGSKFSDYMAGSLMASRVWLGGLIQTAVGSGVTVGAMYLNRSGCRINASLRTRWRCARISSARP